MIQIGTTAIDAQTFEGKGRYLVNINLATVHLEILQRWTAREIKKGPSEAYTQQVQCPEIPRDERHAI
jgi:hypothetical protein